MYYVYMLRCENNSIYTGITTDIERRMREHFTHDKKCAKYTMTHYAKKIERVWETETRVLACRLEYYIKTLKKEQKEELIKDEELLEQFLAEKIDCNDYKKIK